MTKKLNNIYKDDKQNDLDDICENCSIKDESVSQNLILTGYKICESCRISKLLYPI